MNPLPFIFAAFFGAIGFLGFLIGGPYGAAVGLAGSTFFLLVLSLLVSS